MSDDRATHAEPAAWTPLVSGEEAQRVGEIVDEIATALWQQEPNEAGLGGASGLALLFAYLGMATQNERATERATALLDRTMLLATRTQDLSLFAGLAGAGWTIQLLASPEVDDPDDPNLTIDRAITRLLDVPQWQSYYDLISGLAGHAVYALARLPRPSAMRMLERIVEHLGTLAVRDRDGITWHTPPDQLPPWQREAAPSGYFNLGLAHGVPAVICVLARIVAANVAVERARPLLDGAVRWLLAQRLDPPGGRFGSWLAGRPSDREPARSAWCYGDPGVAMTLLGAGRCVGERAWEDEAIELLVAAGKRPAERCGVMDTGLCHGAFGLSTLFQRAYHVTGVPALRDSALAWLERGLAMRRPELPIAGFPTHPNVSEPDPRFLTGAAGIALALLGAVTDVEPAWHGLLLLDGT